MIYKKSPDGNVFMAFYGHIGFAAVQHQPGSRQMSFGIVDDADAVELEMDVCNRADYETFIEGINDPTGIVNLYQGLIRVLVKEGLTETISPEE
jgi:hypothetical protein